MSWVGFTSMKFQGPMATLDGFEDGVLPDALGAAEDEGVVDLLTGSLHALCEPPQDMVTVGRVDASDVGDPPLRLRGVAGNDARRAVRG